MDGVTRELLADTYGSTATHASLHTADPGTALTSEVTGGTYARKALTWATGTAGDGIKTATAVFDVPAGVGSTHACTVSASTGGRQIDKVAAVYAAQGTAGQLTVTFTFTQNA